MTENKRRKAELVTRIRNDRLSGLTYPEISTRHNVSESSVKKYCVKNVLGQAVFFPIRKARRDRCRKVVSYLRDTYKMTYNSIYQYLLSLGVRWSEDGIKEAYYGRKQRR